MVIEVGECSRFNTKLGCDFLIFVFTGFAFYYWLWWLTTFDFISRVNVSILIILKNGWMFGNYYYNKKISYLDWVVILVKISIASKMVQGNTPYLRRFTLFSLDYDRWVIPLTHIYIYIVTCRFYNRYRLFSLLLHGWFCYMLVFIIQILKGSLF